MHSYPKDLASITIPRREPDPPSKRENRSIRSVLDPPSKRENRSPEKKSEIIQKDIQGPEKD